MPVHRALVAVRSGFNKYPHSILRINLDRIYIIRELTFSGISAGGTNSFNRIYVSAGEEAGEYTSESIESAFHHELSSILLRNYPEYFSERDWIAANPAGFRYHESGTNAIKAGKDSEEYDANLAKNGFFSEYAMWTLEDDFNTIATALFCGDEDLWLEVDRHSPIDTKVTIVIDFYRSLDEELNREFFRGMASLGDR